MKRKLKTTLQLSHALQKLQDEAIKKVKSFFHRKPYEIIRVDNSRHLHITVGTQGMTVYSITKSGKIFASLHGGHGLEKSYLLEELSADALLTILDELERMKEHNQLKKP